MVAQDSPDLSARDRELADIEQVRSGRFTVGEALVEASLLRLGQRIDGQFGIVRRAVNDDSDAAALHGISPDRPDGLRNDGILLVGLSAGRRWSGHAALPV